MKVILLTDSIPIRASNTGIPNTGILGYRRKPGRY